MFGRQAMPTTTNRISLLPTRTWLERAGEQQPNSERERDRWESERARLCCRAWSIVIPEKKQNKKKKHTWADWQAQWRRGGTYLLLVRGDQASLRPCDSAWRQSVSSEMSIPHGSHLRREKFWKKTFWKKYIIFYQYTSLACRWTPRNKKEPFALLWFAKE